MDEVRRERRSHREGKDRERDKGKDKERHRSHHRSHHSSISISRRHHHRDRSKDRERDKGGHRHNHHTRHRSDSRQRKLGKRDRSKSPVHKEEQNIVVDEDEDGEWVIEEDDDNENVESSKLATNENQISYQVEEDTTTKLNRLKAEMYKAEMRGLAERVSELKQEYKKLKEDEITNASDSHIKIIDQRFLPKSKGDENDNNNDPSIHEMLRQELETKDGSQLDKKMASAVAKDGTFSNDIDYQDDRASKLATITAETDNSIKSRAITKTRRLAEIIDNCWLCIEDKMPHCTVISAAHRSYLCLAPQPELVKGTVAISPMDHHVNMLECDADEWEEIRNFMKSLTKMWNDQGRSVLFYESAASRSEQKHASIFAIPISHELLKNAIGYFKQGFMEISDEWSSNKQIINTMNKGRYGFQTSMAKEAPYFHVWFDIDGGIGHYIETKKNWPKGDRFARQVIGGMMNLPTELYRKSGEWVNDQNSKQALYFKHFWKSYDWTLQLYEE